MADVQVINLRKNYSEPLLRRFYEELMAPSFGQFEVCLRLDVNMYVTFRLGRTGRHQRLDRPTHASSTGFHVPI